MNIQAAIRAIQQIRCAAQMLGMNPRMPWNELEKLTRYVQLVQKEEECPSLEQIFRFLSSIPYEHSRQLFMAVRFLMETMTNEGVSFGEVMDSFLRMEEDQKRRRYVNDGPPPIPGVPAQVYSLNLWRVVKQMHKLQSSLRPVTRSLLSCSHVMGSPSAHSAQYGFYILCLMHGMNPWLKLVTVSPGMFRIFLRKLRAKAAASGQNCSQNIYIFARLYGLNRRMLQNI
jgi:hypothetical protein